MLTHVYNEQAGNKIKIVALICGERRPIDVTRIPEKYYGKFEGNFVSFHPYKPQGPIGPDFSQNLVEDTLQKLSNRLLLGFAPNTTDPYSDKEQADGYGTTSCKPFGDQQGNIVRQIWTYLGIKYVCKSVIWSYW